jgi:hypothetical protein
MSKRNPMSISHISRRDAIKAIQSGNGVIDNIVIETESGMNTPIDGIVYNQVGRYVQH